MFLHPLHFVGLYPSKRPFLWPKSSSFVWVFFVCFVFIAGCLSERKALCSHICNKSPKSALSKLRPDGWGKVVLKWKSRIECKQKTGWILGKQKQQRFAVGGHGEELIRMENIVTGLGSRVDAGTCCVCPGPAGSGWQTQKGWLDGTQHSDSLWVWPRQRKSGAER